MIQHDCVNLEKVLKLTEIISSFDDNEKKNITDLLANMAKVFKCDEIAFIQKQSDSTTFPIISPSETFCQKLLNKDIYKCILSLSFSLSDPLILNHTFEINPYYKIENFVIISPVILRNEFIGCIFASYLPESIGSHLFRIVDLSYYKLATNIISIQENSYRVKHVLKVTNEYRKLLNNLSEKLITAKNHEMDSYIDDCIRQTCEMWNIDRGYLFIVDFKNEKLKKTNEWCAEGIPSLLDKEKSIPFELFPWEHIIHKFNTDPTTPIHIPNMLNKLEKIFKSVETKKDIQPEIEKSVEYLISSKNLKSVLLIPVSDHYNDNVFTLAILGFSQVKLAKEFPEQLIDMLKVLSFYISEAVKRRREYQNISNLNRTTLENILKWEEEAIEENKIFKNLSSKMKAIFDDHNLSKGN